MLDFKAALGLLVCCSVAAQCEAQFAGMTCGVDLADLSGWDIVVAAKAPAGEHYAAEEFQRFYAQASGTTLPIAADTCSAEKHILLGLDALECCCEAAFQSEDFGDEDFRILIGDERIVIAGGRPRGTLYGVYTFLEDYLGVRFLTADHTYVPPVGPWRVVGPIDRFYHPPLEYRFSFYGETVADQAFAVRLRCNGTHIDERLGGRSRLRGVNHSFHHQIPASRYGKDHPEYFCEIDGKRLAEVRHDNLGNQPCLSHPDVLRIVTDSVLSEIAEKPQFRSVSVSQNDNNKHCQCAACAAIDKREGAPMGSVLTFVNTVADEVAREHSDIKVGTLAYWYSRKPPRTLKPRPNVQIQLCSIECSMLQPVNDPDCGLNVAFCRDFERWSEICQDIRIWNYTVNFSSYLLPCPNLRTIGPDIRYYVSKNVKSMFVLGAYNTTGAEMSELRNYLTSRLLWNPNLDGEALIDEFLELHYGDAARPIRRFIDLTHDRAEALGIEKNCYGTAEDFGIDPATAQAGLAAFTEAMALAENDVVRARVEKASVCAYRAMMEPVWRWTRRNVWELRDTPEKAEKEMDREMAQHLRPYVKHVLELCEKHDIAMWEEGSHRGGDVQWAKKLLRKAYQLGPDESF